MPFVLVVSFAVQPSGFKYKSGRFRIHFILGILMKGNCLKGHRTQADVTGVSSDILNNGNKFDFSQYLKVGITALHISIGEKTKSSLFKYCLEWQSFNHCQCWKQPNLRVQDLLISPITLNSQPRTLELMPERSLKLI